MFFTTIAVIGPEKYLERLETSKNCSQIYAKFKNALRSNGTKHTVHLTSRDWNWYIKMEVFYKIVDFFVLDMCSKLTFCSNVAQKGKYWWLLKPLPQTPKVAQKLPSTIGTGYLLFHSYVYFRSLCCRFLLDWKLNYQKGEPKLTTMKVRWSNVVNLSNCLLFM